MHVSMDRDFYVKPSIRGHLIDTRPRHDGVMDGVIKINLNPVCMGVFKIFLTLFFSSQTFFSLVYLGRRQGRWVSIAFGYFFD